MGVLMGAIASALLLVGGLGALQQGAVLASVPFTFVLVGLTYCLTKAIREEQVPQPVPLRATPLRAPAPAPAPLAGRGVSGMSRTGIALLLAGALALGACGDDDATAAGRPSRRARAADHARDAGLPRGAPPRRAVAPGARGQRLHGQPAQAHRPRRGPRPGAARRRHRRPRRLHRYRVVDRRGRGGLGPRSGDDVRPGEGVLLDPRHGDELDDAVRGRRRDRHHRRVRAGARARGDRGPARARRIHARGATGVREPLPGARGAGAGLRPHERDVRGRHARGAVHRTRRGGRGRRQRVHHRSAARERGLRGARGPGEAVRLPERRHGGRRRQARDGRAGAVPARGRRGQPPAHDQT